jgi:hypothetical protein
MKYLEVIETQVTPSGSSAPGVYLWSGMLYFAPGNGVYPMSCMLGNIQFVEQLTGPNGGISEGTFLKALALMADSTTAHKVVDKS